MRVPIKLSVDRVPPRLRSLLPCAYNLRRLARNEIVADDFSLHASMARIGGTWRSTAAGRQPRSDARLVELARAHGHPAVLDVGASDGSTSLDLIRALGPHFARYHVTDRDGHLDWTERDGVCWFYEPRSGRCTLRASERLVVYTDLERALPGLGTLARALLTGAPAHDPERMQRLDLHRPELVALAERDPRIQIACYDVFEPWQGEPVDLVKVANLLNPGYFDPAQLAAAIEHLSAALREGGALMIVDNRRDAEPIHHRGPSSRATAPVEAFSLFRKVSGRLELEQEVEGGAEAAAAVRAV